MQNRNAAHYKTERVENLQSPPKRVSKSQDDLARIQSTRAWGDGFVKPDGTRIRLFVTPRA